MDRRPGCPTLPLTLQRAHTMTEFDPNQPSQYAPSSSAGWYPDGQGGQRWWDGRAWGVYAPPVQPKSGGANVPLILLLAAIGLAIVGVVVEAQPVSLLTGPGTLYYGLIIAAGGVFAAWFNEQAPRQAQPGPDLDHVGTLIGEPVELLRAAAL
jgi:Protein of unknown function (DUF2510)